MVLISECPAITCTSSSFMPLFNKTVILVTLKRCGWACSIFDFSPRFLIILLTFSDVILLYGLRDTNRASEVTRVIDQLNYLKANLKDIKDKNKRKAIEKDIASIEKTLKEFEKASNDPVSVQRYNKLKNSFAFDRNAGELAYRVRRRHYDVKGNWKNLI